MICLLWNFAAIADKLSKYTILAITRQTLLLDSKKMYTIFTIQLIHTKGISFKNLLHRRYFIECVDLLQ